MSISSLRAPLEPPPSRLRRFQFFGIGAQCVSIGLQVSHLAFGMWRHARWVDGAAIACSLIFLTSVAATLKWQRAQRKRQRCGEMT